VIIGDGPLREDLERRGRALPNPPRFLYLPPGELPRWYNAADLYVHAADVEVECMTVLEAMGCGLPCLIARSPKSATQQFALGDEWLYRWDSRDELTARLDALLDEPGKLQAARAPSAKAAQRYSIQDSLALLLDVYRRVTTTQPIRRVCRFIPAETGRSQSIAGLFDGAAHR
jgi:glycosyltransferase involved in cell wall biosynthesis